MSFWDGLFGRKRDSSAELAKQRLLTVLIDDRYKLTPEMMAQMKADLAEVLKRYLPAIDAEQIEVTLSRGEAHDLLKADVPLRRAPDSQHNR
ncbi:cell division topological specificity factor MinE [Chloroflexus sp.]|uniref:cell division topological specificity factor MinE n=1 Tax=Chloroflexus sp. TaxID=1904827 RepID=UPI002ACEAD1C|nr:cell division topological specificity factor MinE [Chloroflexus sp.]MCX7858553.1 cell division topological specificity factor MinE [Chloroflexus sp.]